MSNDTNSPQPMSTGAESQQEPIETQLQAAGVVGRSHGSTGEGAGSAMARLISQEQARIVPGAPEDAPTGSS